MEIKREKKNFSSYKDHIFKGEWKDFFDTGVSLSSKQE